MPGSFKALGEMTVAEVNIPVALLFWLMIVPMLLKVDFGALGGLGLRRRSRRANSYGPSCRRSLPSLILDWREQCAAQGDLICNG
jgi:hypothetical protein